jgi:hypothetical protein
MEKFMYRNWPGKIPERGSTDLWSSIGAPAAEGLRIAAEEARLRIIFITDRMPARGNTLHLETNPLNV